MIYRKTAILNRLNSLAVMGGFLKTGFHTMETCFKAHFAARSPCPTSPASPIAAMSGT